MDRQNVIVISQRYPLKAAVEALLGVYLNGRFRQEWSLLDLFDSSSEYPSLVILDVVKLLSAEHTHIPRLTSRSPRVLVLGFRADSAALISAWNEGIPAHVLEDMTADTLAQMTTLNEGGFDIYEYMGRRSAERVHSFLARKALARVLSSQEVAAVELLCIGYSNVRIARQLGLEEKTVKNHLTHVYQKLGVSSRYELMARYLEMPSSPYQSTSLSSRTKSR